METVGAAMAQPVGASARAVLVGASLGAPGRRWGPRLGTPVEAASAAARPCVGLANCQRVDRLDRALPFPRGRSFHSLGGTPGTIGWCRAGAQQDRSEVPQVAPFPELGQPIRT